MKEKITVTPLPLTAEFRKIKRYREDRGEIALIEDGPLFRHLSVFSLRCGPAYYRGGHYHLKKTEHFYIVSGKIRILTVDLDTGTRGFTDVAAGDKVTIRPRLAHRFHALQEAWAVEYYNGTYDPEDDIPFSDFPDPHLS